MTLYYNNNMIVFDEESHTYTNTETKKTYISATTLLGEYKKKFDSVQHATRVANREGVTVDFVLEDWANTTKIATDRGTKIHKLMEAFIKTGETDQSYGFLYKSYTKFVKDHIDSHKCVLSEELLYLHEYGVAGTTDIIYDDDKFFTVADFKTNKRFRFSSNFNEYLLAPVDHLQYCEFNSYALQLSLYAYMYECKTGKKCKKIVLLYLDADTWVPYTVNYLKSDIINILNDYKQRSV